MNGRRNVGFWSFALFLDRWFGGTGMNAYGKGTEMDTYTCGRRRCFGRKLLSLAVAVALVVTVVPFGGGGQVFAMAKAEKPADAKAVSVASGDSKVVGDSGGGLRRSARLGVEPDGAVALREVRRAPREEGVDVYGLPSVAPGKAKGAGVKPEAVGVAAPYIAKSPADGVFAKGATLRLYLSAASTDGGFLTYQWWRSPLKAEALVPAGGGGVLSDEQILALKADPNKVAISEADGGKKSILQTSAGSQAGYYYYWATVTNNLDKNNSGDIIPDEQTSADTFVAEVRVVDRTLPSALANGKFEEFAQHGTAGWPWKQYSDGYDAAAYSTGRSVLGSGNNVALTQAYWNTTAYDATTNPTVNKNCKRIYIQ
jgi:hypothetical protein